MNGSEEIKLTVIMPIFNAYDYLRPAMDSVLAQTMRDIEIICVDDGSTDSSLDLIKEYQKQDGRIRILTENNAGQSIARNKGFARARGEYVIFLDADDFFEPDLLEKLYTVAVSDQLDIAVGAYDVYNSRTARFEPMIRSEHSEILADGEVFSKNEYPDYIFSSVTTYVWNKLFKRSFLVDKGIFFPENSYVFEDVYFVLAALSMAERVGGVTDILLHHRVYNEQYRRKLFGKYYGDVPEVYLMVKEYLMHNGMYVPLYQSFLNYTASRAYKVYNLLWREAKEEFWNSLHEFYAEQLGWTKAGAGDFEDVEIRDFTASVLIYNHAQYLKREERGYTVNIDGVGQEIKRVRFRKRVKRFFSRLFGRK